MLAHFFQSLDINVGTRIFRSTQWAPCINPTPLCVLFEGRKTGSMVQMRARQVYQWFAKIHQCIVTNSTGITHFQATCYCLPVYDVLARTPAMGGTNASLKVGFLVVRLCCRNDCQVTSVFVFLEKLTNDRVMHNHGLYMPYFWEISIGLQTDILNLQMISVCYI